MLHEIFFIKKEEGCTDLGLGNFEFYQVETLYPPCGFHVEIQVGGFSFQEH